MTFTRSNSNEEGGLSASSDCSSNTEMNSANSSSVGMTFTSGSSSDDEGITANCECRGNKENSSCTRRCTQENKIFADSKGTCEKEKISAPSSSEGIKLTNSSCKPVLLMHHDSSTEEINFPIWLKYLKGSSRLVRNMNLNSTRGRTSEEEDIANNKCSSDTESSKSSSDIEMIFASGSSVGMYSSRSSGSEEEEIPVNSKCSSGGMNSANSRHCSDSEKTPSWSSSGGMNSTRSRSKEEGEMSANSPRSSDSKKTPACSSSGRMNSARSRSREEGEMFANSKCT